MILSNILEKEKNNLDLIRIILACLVIVCHSPTLNGNSNFWIDPISFFFKYTNSGDLTVKLFFFISGLVVTKSYLYKRNAGYFILSRIFRIIPALLFVILITVFIIGPIVTHLSLGEYFSSQRLFLYIKNNIFFNTDYLLPGIFENNFYPNAVNGSLWSLRYEVGCYIGLLLLFLIIGKQNKYYLNIPILLIIIDTFLPYRVVTHFFENIPAIYKLTSFFAFGALLAINADKIKINYITTSIAIAICYISYDLLWASEIFVFTTCIVIVYLASNKFVLKIKPKHDISYGIYLWGFVVQQTLYHFTGHLYVGFHCIIALIVSGFLAYISFKYIEKPGIELGKKAYQLYKTNFPYINQKI